MEIAEFALRCESTFIKEFIDIILFFQLMHKKPEIEEKKSKEN